MPKTFKIEFKNTSKETVGALYIEGNDSPIKFYGDVDQSARLFFNHIKKKIEEYVETEKEHDFSNDLKIGFENFDSDVVATLTIANGEEMRYSGNVGETANIFFKTLKGYVDEHLGVGRGINDTDDCINCGDKKVI